MSKANLSIGVMIATVVAVMALFFLPCPTAPRLTVATVRSGLLEKVCMLQGRSVKGEQIPVVSPVMGKVAQIYVRSGDKVSAGQLLLRLDAGMEEQALSILEGQLHQLQSNLSRVLASDIFSKASMLPLNDLAEQKFALAAAIECKQIRAIADGTVENFYVKSGDLVGEYDMIGTLWGTEQKVVAYWTAQQGQPPVPGMQAWWCDGNGMRQEMLILESVGVPIEQNQMLVYPLFFHSMLGSQTMITQDDTAPVCLVLQDVSAKAIVPVEALDRHEQLWVLQDGYVKPVPAQLGQSDHEVLQVQDELSGKQVILNPDDLPLMNGMAIRMPEGM
ncbi:MAG: biotin/lipoyl-binding protein [Clostridiales bacterium]|nr:biotin/lipoyl-binding protein [Clostridiales bacterium]